MTRARSPQGRVRALAVLEEEPLSRWLIPSSEESPGGHDRLEAFIGARLSEAGHWRTARESDGVRDVSAEATGHVDWTLYYDLAPSRRGRSSIYVLEAPEEESWQVQLAGRAPR